MMLVKKGSTGTMTGLKEISQPRPGFMTLVDCDDGARLSQCLRQHLGIFVIARRGLWQGWNALREVLS